MLDDVFDPFGERLDPRARDGRPAEPRSPAGARSLRRRYAAGAALFWIVAAGLLIARGAYFDRGTAFGTDAPEQVASANQFVIR
ncbi:hypothetical protein [uncultured Methylobacterium sp.]|jgi:hypothetical protein|uniref:hypothetical protein n=1 Tax=uncultured Methylobacterium sp. TaxID=157278 RepID=UPI00261170D3|nr:hypothetical protein [uncultured Methylobacterium sp.]